MLSEYFTKRLTAGGGVPEIVQCYAEAYAPRRGDGELNDLTGPVARYELVHYAYAQYRAVSIELHL